MISVIPRENIESNNEVYTDKIEKSSLISKNIFVHRRRTSVKLEAEIWELFKDIAVREKCTIHDIASLLFIRKKNGTSLTSAIRVFIAVYYKSAETEDGHRYANHGNWRSSVSQK